jgi:hypothetical protein
MSGTHHAKSWANVFWCNLAGGASCSQADLDAWLVKFRAACVSPLFSEYSSNITAVEWRATLFQTGGTVLQSTNTSSAPGTGSATEVLDNAVCKVISWGTSVYWRGGKPRTYIPGIASADTPDGVTIGATALGNLKTHAAGFLTAVNAITQGTITTTTMGFVSFRSGLADRVPPVFFPFTGSTAHTRLGTQRRRLGKWSV